MAARYVQMWLPGFAPVAEQPELPGLDPNEGIEPSEGDLTDAYNG